MYSIPMLSAAGCDSIVDLTLDVLAPESTILTPDTLTCAVPTITLDGSTSMPAGGIEYSWTLEGDATVLGTSPTILVDDPGRYLLTVSQSDGGLTCTATDTVVVVADTIAPIADAGLPDTLNCLVDTLILGGSGTSAGLPFTYAWATTNGQFISPTTQPETTINSPGIYTLIVTDQDNGCTDTASVLIAIDTISPVADAGADQLLDCVVTQVELDGSASSIGSMFAYSWSSAEGITPGNAATLEPVVIPSGNLYSGGLQYSKLLSCSGYSPCYTKH
jgi:hypothetical protein